MVLSILQKKKRAEALYLLLQSGIDPEPFKTADKIFYVHGVDEFEEGYFDSIRKSIESNKKKAGF